MINNIQYKVITPVSSTLSANTPEDIRDTVAAGVASNYWSVGDKIGIQLSGTVGSLTLNGTYYAYVIGFNHNSIREGSNTLHLQFAKNASNVSIAFVDSDYCSYEYANTNRFSMTTGSSNSGGWASSTMRTKRCAEFLAAMPTDWQDVIASCTKYSDNTGGSSTASSYVTATSDKIWLLSEFEVQGARTYANSNEKNYQKQYTYYSNGNSKIKYKHSSTSTSCYWWLRSVYASSSLIFCNVHVGGTANYAETYLSLGFAPGFMIA